MLSILKLDKAERFRQSKIRIPKSMDHYNDRAKRYRKSKIQNLKSKIYFELSAVHNVFYLTTTLARQ